MTFQTTSHILMVRPSNFGFNEETAASNAFQVNDATRSAALIAAQAVREFDAFVEKLRSAGVDVIVANDTDQPVKPDAVFPNNWVTFHQDGSIVTYPMFAPTRRMERREDIIQDIQKRFRAERKIQLEEFETVDEFLEGTGSMIIDRQNHLVYACLSPRTTANLLTRFCKLMRYEPVAFHAVDGSGQEIYHTNVMMALGETFVVICMETVRREREANLLRQKFAETGKEIIEISLA
ncbi:MAG: arginine deiminase-related protein, partial [Bacteroidota bacterium]